MPEWLKLGGSFIALCAFVWAMLQQHDYRLSKLEDGFEAHLIKHDEQYKDIQKSLRDIDVSLARIYTGQETRR